MSPHINVIPVRLVASLVVFRQVMTVDEQNIFDKFMKLGPSKFSDLHKENAYEILVSF